MRESSLYRLLAENMLDVIAATDEDATIRYVSPSVQRLLGFEPNELIGSKNVAIIHPDDTRRIRNARTETPQPAEGETLTLRLQRRDGSYVWCETRVRQVHDGRTGWKFVSVTRDASGRVKAEDACNEAVMRTPSLLADMFEGYAYCRIVSAPGDPVDFVYLDANAAFQTLTGLGDPIGLKVSELVPGVTQTSAKLFELYARVAKTGKAERVETRVPGLDGQWFSVACYPAGPDCFIAVFDNITECKQAAEQIERLNASLENRIAKRTSDLTRAYKALETFSSSVSHDLRAPLHTLKGFADALAQDFGDRLGDVGLDYLRRINGTCEQMTMLIDDLLSLSKVSWTQMKVEPIDLSFEMASIAAELQSRAPSREVRFTIQQGIHAKADPVLIRTVLWNLADNAWKFTSSHEKARIEFGVTSTPDGEPCYFLRDDGVGFDPTYAGKLFEPFQRLHSAAEFPGTGVGLASVRRIAERHGGRAWIEAELNRGAVVYFTLNPTPAEENRRAGERGSQPGDPNGPRDVTEVVRVLPKKNGSEKKIPG